VFELKIPVDAVHWHPNYDGGAPAFNIQGPDFQ
jgi:hypothetical protein